MAEPSMRVRVRTPATSANLGPGFDTLGLALTLADEVTARIATSGVTVAVHGEGAGALPTDGRHLVVRSMDAAFDLLGERPSGLALECRNRIPQARGLGSSSAAIVAGVLAARALVAEGTARLPDEAVLMLAAELEGHPDNVAPCLLGGFTIAWTQSAGTQPGGTVPAGTQPGGTRSADARAVRLVPSGAVRPVVFVPADRGLTEHARAVLPATVPHVDAAYNAGRAALLVHALITDPTLLLSATDDRLHQPYRAAAAPATAALVSSLREAGVAAVVSGAGPSVLALVGVDWTPPEAPGWAVLPLEVDLEGATVTIEAGAGTVGHAERDPVAAGRAS